jgi:predicted PurR-regulated permease PerM
LVSKDAELHPVLTLLGVVGGIKAFGFFGFIFGPVIMILFITTLEIYIKYYSDPNDN